MTTEYFETNVHVDKEWKLHWKQMPEFTQENKNSFKKITMKFKTKDDYESFSKIIGQDITEKTKSIWHPEQGIVQNKKLRWIVPNEIINPTYPVYIISKGRHSSMFTSRSLSRMKVPHYISVEPQDYDLYDKALDEFQIREYVTLLLLPFSNHGDGPGRARNWCWDHAISIGAKKHWVLDDNIQEFYRFHNNIRVRVDSGVIFKMAEDFVERFSNVPVSGFQYRFFIAPNSAYPAFVKNTRIYSCLLISNDCKHRWRGRYNEDTDLSLRVLKDGDCTIQFNAFLQGKCATQTVGGGNTAEFYHAEGKLDKSKWRDGTLNATGTINKSQMLVDMHPDVCRIVWKYGRWHHFCDYLPFKDIQLKYKEEYATIPDGVNNYGMEWIDNYGE